MSFPPNGKEDRITTEGSIDEKPTCNKPARERLLQTKEKESQHVHTITGGSSAPQASFPHEASQADKPPYTPHPTPDKTQLPTM